MKKILPIMAMLALTLSGCAPIPPAPEKATVPNTYRQVTTQEAVEIMEQEKNYIILDVRTPQEYSIGHIPNAVLIPNETIGTEDLPQLPDKSQLILVYCRSGNRSKQAAEKLVKLGYTNIVEFGGIYSWTGDIVAD